MVAHAGRMGWWGGHGDVVFPNRDNVIPTTDGLDNLRRLVKLTAGPHTITVDVEADGSGDQVQVRLAWVTPEMKERAFAEAIVAARSSKVAVVFAWSRNRPFFGLPGDQDRLIAEVAAVNPNTIVVLNTGQAVAMPWLKDVRAVLEMWYTGDEGGWAAANLLTGKVSPAGRLPFTWPRRFEDGPATDPAHPERSSRGVAERRSTPKASTSAIDGSIASGSTRCSRSVSGSRTRALSTRDCRCRARPTAGSTSVAQSATSALARPTKSCRFTSARPRRRAAGVDFAVRALADFQRITLRPGEAKSVRLHIAPDRLRYWSIADSAWHVVSGARTVYVGASSRDLRLRQRVSRTTS